MLKDKRKARERQGKSAWLEGELFAYLRPLLKQLDQQMDRRLVQTFFGLVIGILKHRDRNNGLLLSELGSYLLGAERCTAGTKRISNLIRSEKWRPTKITDFQWEGGRQRIDELLAQGEIPLVIWDESVIEKPESIQAEGLCPVRSTKAVRLKRIKPGYFNPPGGRPVFVPGFHWLQVLVAGRKGPPTLGHMRWWSTRGERKTDKREEERLVMRQIEDLWGKEVVHIWDRGFAGAPWLEIAFTYAARFVMRWPKHYKLIDPDGHLKKAWEINRGKRSWEHRLLWDARRRCHRKTGGWLSRFSTHRVWFPCGWLSPDGDRDNLPGICSPQNRSFLLLMPGMLFSPMLVDGRLRWRSGITKPNWLSNLPDWRLGNIASSSS